MSVILRADGHATKYHYLRDMKQVTSQWRLILHYDSIPRPGPEELRLAKDLKAFYHHVPHPYGEDDLHLARPELYAKVSELARDASAQFESYLKDLTRRMGQRATLPTDEKAFSDMRRIGLLMLDLEVAANSYVHGEGAYFIPQLERYLFDEATEPAALNDPTKRYCIEDRKQLELTGPLGEEDCRDLENMKAAKRAREEAENAN